MNQSVLSGRTCMKRSPYNFLATTKRREIIPTEQYSAISEELSKKIPAEDESDALYQNGEVTNYSDQQNCSEPGRKDNPFHEEYSDSNLNSNVCIIHPFNI
ncbi:hypothetical protein AVEN_128278-1 [Araneus ventricosus]|uniref:Uncharacterized protein n=1 Tax=Araneus ventricosus TaxID=182803 RepID=A0A4Y2FSC9_ARAVE|nr:hypothetical protein AVEN_128278-1 [Araneus ventricosus]